MMLLNATAGLEMSPETLQIAVLVVEDICIITLLALAHFFAMSVLGRLEKKAKHPVKLVRLIVWFGDIAVAFVAVSRCLQHMENCQLGRLVWQLLTMVWKWLQLVL